MKQIVKWLKASHACPGGLEYAINSETPKKWWDECEQPDWLFWVLRRLARHLDNPHRKFARIALLRAKSVLHLVDEKETRPKEAIELVEKWLNGENVTKEQLRTAAYAAAAAAAYAAYADAAAAAAYAAAADAAYAAYAAAAAAAYAAYAAAADAAYAAYAAAADAAYAAYAAAADAADADAASKKQRCDIIRRQFSWQEIKSCIYEFQSEGE